MNHHPSPPRDPAPYGPDDPWWQTEHAGYPACMPEPGEGRGAAQESEMQDRVEIVARIRDTATTMAARWAAFREDPSDHRKCRVDDATEAFEKVMSEVTAALDAVPREVTEGMVEAAYAAFKAYWSTVTNCYLSTADINLSAMRAALIAALSGAADGKQSLPTEAPPADERETVEAKWEAVLQDKSDTTERMRVPGGWLYRNIWLNDYSSVSEGYRGQMVFVPVATIAQGGER